MGKRRSKKTNNELKNVSTRNKSIVLTEQNDTKRDQDKNMNRNPQVLLSKKNEEGNYEKSMHEKPSSSRIQVSNGETCLYSGLTKFLPNTSAYEMNCSIMPSKDRSFSDMSGAKAKNKFNGVHSNQKYGRVNCDFKRSSPHFSHNVSDIDSDDNYDDFSQPDFDSFPRTKNYLEERSGRKSNAKESLYTSVNEYNSSKNSFLQMFKKWEPEREATLVNLRSLYEEVLSAQKKYNTTQANCKEFSSGMRRTVINSESSAGSFFASFAGFAFDAMSGVASLAQAFSIDAFQTKFQELMEHDAEITKEMYETRSWCIAKYNGIEEVMRKFHSDTFSSTVSKISNTLEVGKYWESMKTAYKNDDMEALSDMIGKFFNNACQSEVLGEIGDAVGRYVTDNPAALDACKSTGKAVYGAVNTLAPNFDRRARGRINCATNCYLMLDDMEDANRFKNAAADEDFQGSKLVMQIEDALNSLQAELEEMNKLYIDYLKN